MNEQDRYAEWASRLHEIAQEMSDAGFDGQTLHELARSVHKNAERCSELAS